MGSGTSSPSLEADGSEVGIEHLSRRMSRRSAMAKTKSSSMHDDTFTLNDCRALFGPEILDRWPRTKDAVERGQS